jgi:hypothetical protein
MGKTYWRGWVEKLLTRSEYGSCSYYQLILKHVVAKYFCPAYSLSLYLNLYSSPVAAVLIVMLMMMMSSYPSVG